MDTTTPLVTAGNSKADAATNTAVLMLQNGLLSRQPRFDSIRKNEDMYNGVNPPALKGRSNIPFDSIVMGGFVDTLLSNIDEPVDLHFDRKREQDKLAADKITAVWQDQSSQNKAAWNDKIQDAKFLATLAGRGFLKLFMTSVPKFATDLETCDHYDMVTEPQGGPNLDKHLFKFQMNIFRTKQDMLSAADAGFYDKTQVRKFILASQDETVFKRNTDEFANKLNRYAAFGIDINANSYVGQTLYRLVEGVISYESKWYYIVFSYEAKTWLRFEPLEDVFEHAKDYPGRGPWVSFATHRHPFLFWNKAPADDVRPIAYTMKKVVNLTIDNLEKRNWDMKAYNPKIFNDPSQLLYRQDGLVRASLKNGEDINKGIFQFQTPDTTGITINLTQWLNAFLGQKTGITPDSMGASQSDRVGITVTNLQQTSKRMMLYNKNYRKALTDLGTMFDYGLYEHLNESVAVKIIGNDGVRWDEDVTHNDTVCEFSITVTSATEEDEKNAVVMAKKADGFKAIEANPALLGGLNGQWYLAERLKFIGYNDEQIRIALDKTNNADDILMAQCAQSIQDIVEGEQWVPLNRNATSAFVQKIVNFAQQSYPLYPVDEVAKMSIPEQKRYKKGLEVFDRLTKYAADHVPIMQANMKRKIVLDMASRPGGLMGPGGGTPQAGASGGAPAMAGAGSAANAPMPTAQPGAVPSPFQA